MKNSTILRLTLPLTLLLASCGGDDTPSDPFNVGIARTVTLEPFDRSAPGGGDVASLSVAGDGEIVGVLDGDLVRIKRDGTLTVLDDLRDYLWGIETPVGHIVGVTRDDIVYVPDGSFVPRVVPFDPTGSSGAILEVQGRFSADGSIGVISVLSDEPRTRAWYTIDGGSSWEVLTLPGGATSLRLRADFAFLADRTLLVGSADGLYAAGAPGGVWNERTRTMPNRATALLTTSEGTIYRYSPGEGGLAVSGDGGRNFTDVWFNALPPFFVEVQEGPDGALLALANRTKVGGGDPLERPMGLYRSTDGGRSWSEIMPMTATTLLTRGSTIALGLTNGPVAGLPQPGGIVLSRDRGESWELLGRGIAGSGEEVDDFSFVGEGDLLILSRGGIYRNGSLRLGLLGVPFGPEWIAGTRSGDLWWQTSRGTYRMAVGAGGVEEIEGIDPAAVPVPLRSGAILFLSDDRIDRYTAAEGLVRISQDPPGLAEIVEVADRLLLGVSVDGKVRESTDGGATWSSSERPVTLSCNSLGGCIVTLDGVPHLLAPDHTNLSPLEFIGLPGTVPDIAEIAYDPRDRLWVRMKNGTLLASDVVVR